MVYKKITDKIPSLSSLLLAGLLMGSGCPGKNNSDTANNKDGKEAADAKKDGNAKVPKGPDGKPLSPHYCNANKNIYTYLVDKVAMINRLGSDPYEIGESDFKGDHAEDRLKKLITHFSTSPTGNIYPPSLKNVFSAIRDLNTSTKKYAYGMAFKAIADVWVQLHKYYKDMEAIISEGGKEEKMAILLGKLENFHKDTVHSPESDLVKGEFLNSKETKLLEGAQLARFLTDSDAKGKDKPAEHRYGIPKLLEESAGQVWIMGRSNEAPSVQDPINQVSKRGAAIGAAIGEDWTVMGTSKAPSIPFFSGFGKITKRFESGDSISFQDIDPTTDTKAAGVQEYITYGQVLSTLFNGNTKHDFIEFVPGDITKKWINIKSNNERFQDIYKLCINGNETSGFAQTLGTHINSTLELQSLFCIPILNDIKNLMIKDIKDEIEKDSETVVNAKGSGNMIHKDSVAWRFVVTVGQVLKISKSSTAETLQFLENLAQASGDVLKSDLDINSKIVLKVMKKIFASQKNSDGKVFLLYSLDPQSGKALVEFIEKAIIEELDHAIVYRTERTGKYMSTATTRKIQLFIKKIYENLNKKRGASKVTYAQIGNHCKGFNIEEVRKGINDDYTSLRAVLTSKVETFLNKDSLMLAPETYKLYFPDQALSSGQISNINNIKKEYMNQNKN